jgi:hypothetical protein
VRIDFCNAKSVLAHKSIRRSTMTIEAPTQSIAKGHDLASKSTLTTSCTEQSITATTTMMTATTTTPFSSAQSDDEVKRRRLQVLDEVEGEEDRQEAQQSHDLDNKQEQALNQGGANSYPASHETSRFVADPPGLSRNPPTPPASAAMTARLVPQEYRRGKGVDHSQHSSDAGLLSRGPGAFPIRPTTHGSQDESTHHDDDDDDDDEAMPSTNDERNKSARMLFDDPASALEAQVVPERDLNREVLQKMEAMTIDPIAVTTSKAKNDVPNNGPPSSRRKSTLMITLGVLLMVIVAAGSAIGILASKDKKEPPPTIAPTSVSDMELARAIFYPLSGNETLWDKSSPQYKALWWIVHEDPAKMMMKMQDESQSLSSIIVERYVMALFYFATDGPNWFEQVNFLGNSSICDWQDLIEFDNGINCNDEGSAVELWLGMCDRRYCLQCMSTRLLSAINLEYTVTANRMDDPLAPHPQSHRIMHSTLAFMSRL